MRSKYRGKTFLVCEGTAEKELFIKYLLLAFPEIQIDSKDIVISGCNIHVLYEMLDSEYAGDWTTDFNLPYVLLGSGHAKDEFKNIFLIFDFEPHDPELRKHPEIWEKMLKKFQSETDEGSSISTIRCWSLISIIT